MYCDTRTILGIPVHIKTREFMDSEEEEEVEVDSEFMDSEFMDSVDIKIVHFIIYQLISPTLL
jgi:hypothetical protein